MTNPAQTSPSTSALSSAPILQAPAQAEVVVRRDKRRSLHSAAIIAAGASVLLFWLPALIVILRNEPGYFTGGILWTALIATGLLVGLSVGATLLWLKTGGRDTPILRLDADGVHIPKRRGMAAFDATWESLVLIRVIGHSEPELAFYPRAEPVDADDPEAPELDLSEPEFLRPLDFDNDPPPSTVAPDRELFTHITPVQQEDEMPAEPAPTPARGTENLYATPHVVAVHHTSPPLPEVLIAIKRYANGRVALG